MPPRSTLSEVARFWSHVDRSGGPDACWPWLLSSRRAHQGQFRLDNHGPIATASRYAFEAEVRPLAEGEEACHTCDNPPCCNPKHLFAGTQAANMADRDQKGRTPRGEAVSQSKLTAASIPLVRALAAQGWPNGRVAALFGVTRETVRRVVIGVSWRHVPAPKAA